MPPAPLIYDRDHLAGFVEELERDDAAWNSWFSRVGIEPLRLTYEGLAAEPKGALARVLSALALDATIAASIDVRTAKLADENQPGMDSPLPRSVQGPAKSLTQAIGVRRLCWRPAATIERLIHVLVRHRLDVLSRRDAEVAVAKRVIVVQQENEADRNRA